MGHGATQIWILFNFTNGPTAISIFIQPLEMTCIRGVHYNFPKVVEMKDTSVYLQNINKNVSARTSFFQKKKHLYVSEHDFI